MENFRKTGNRTIELVKVVHKDNENVGRTKNEGSKKFIRNIGVKHGCLLSPLFSVVVDEAIKEARKKMRKIKLECRKMEHIQLTELIFADMAVVAGLEEHNLEVLDK